MLKIREAIVVEGRYDKNTLSQIVDAAIFTTDGFGVMNDREKLRFLRAVAEKRGLIIFTDSDGAGFVIRSYLKGTLPKESVKHAYIPDIPGKEKRKSRPGKEGKLGVEGMRPDVIVQALLRAGATVEGEDASAERGAPITKADLFSAGLSGPGSAEKRERIKTRLGLPAHIGANAMLDALNLMLTREEFFELTQGENQ